MFSLYLLIPISLLFVVLAVSIFCWAVNEGQYDDLDSEGASGFYLMKTTVPPRAVI